MNSSSASPRSIAARLSRRRLALSRRMAASAPSTVLATPTSTRASSGLPCAVQQTLLIVFNLLYSLNVNVTPHLLRHAGSCACSTVPLPCSEHRTPECCCTTCAAAGGLGENNPETNNQATVASEYSQSFTAVTCASNCTDAVPQTAHSTAQHHHSTRLMPMSISALASCGAQSHCRRA
jgi:hypothetical protein